MLQENDNSEFDTSEFDDFDFVEAYDDDLLLLMMIKCCQRIGHPAL